MKRVLALLALVLPLLCAVDSSADTGVIVPLGKSAPDPSILSIESMDVHIVIDNGHALVSLKEVFANHKAEVQEGTYSLALPDGAAVSNFAVWDDLTRIPGVILERKRASQLYNEIRNQVIDPGLLESGEITESTAPGGAQHSTAVTVKITPMPAYGYKRIEAEYRQHVPVAQLVSDFVLPLKPTASNTVRIQNLSIDLELRSAQAITSFQNVGDTFPLKLTKQTANLVIASFSQSDVNLSADFEVKYSFANDATPHVTAYRTGETSEPGYFEASVILQAEHPTGLTQQSPRTVLGLLDTSLSMQWEKLERSFRSLETTLRSLQPKDEFNVLVFNSGVSAFGAKPVAAAPDQIARALDFVRGSKLRGGTNLEAAYTAAFAEATANTYIVLISDGEMTEGTIIPAKF